MGCFVRSSKDGDSTIWQARVDLVGRRREGERERECVCVTSRKYPVTIRNASAYIERRMFRPFRTCRASSAAHQYYSASVRMSTLRCHQLVSCAGSGGPVARRRASTISYRPCSTVDHGYSTQQEGWMPYCDGIGGGAIVHRSIDV